VISFYDIYFNLFKNNISLYYFNYNFFLFFNKRMFFDSLLNLFVGFLIFRISYKIFFLFDKGILELFGPYGILQSFNNIQQDLFKNIHSGYLFYYLIYIIFVIVFLTLLIFYII
jgi:NADH-ubiquinone oxidoreductase chain 5